MSVSLSRYVMVRNTVNISKSLLVKILRDSGVGKLRVVRHGLKLPIRDLAFLEVSDADIIADDENRIDVGTTV